MRDARLQRLTTLFLATLSLSLSACGIGPSSDDLRSLNLFGGDDHSEVIGFYSHGNLLGAVELPSESAAHLKIFRLRNRAWATNTLVNTIVSTAAAFRRVFPYGERVQVGDIASEHGGTLARHLSHQNGLDADVGYLRVNQREDNPNDGGEEGFTETFVVNGRVTKNFDLKRNWFLLRKFVSLGNVSRIFVDADIKRVFCEFSPKIDPSASLAEREEVLRRLRPFKNHADHFHLRLACPINSPKCVSQEEPPSGASCQDINSVSDDEHEMEGIPLS